MRLNDAQIRRIIQHACDKTGYEELSGSIGFYFVEGGSQCSVITCDHNGYRYRPVIKFYSAIFDNMRESEQIKAVVVAACDAVNQYRIKELRQKPKKYAVNAFVRKCFKREPVEQV